MSLTFSKGQRRNSRKTFHKKKVNKYQKAHYDGPSLQQAKQSVRLLLSDQIVQSNLHIQTDSRMFTRVIHAADKFLEGFFDEMQNLNTSKESRTLADSMKEQYQHSAALVHNILNGILDKEIPISFMIQPKDSENGYWLEKVYYLPREFRLLSIDDESQTIIGCFDVEKPKLHYEWLNQALTLLTGLAYNEVGNMFEEEYSKIRQLCNALLSFGELYTFMNPDDETLDEYADSSIDTLEEVIPNELPEEFYVIWDEFCKDLSEGQKPYIREFARALRMTEEYRKSPFDDSDYYISNKATSRSDPRFPRIRQSILASMFEEQHHEDNAVIKEAESRIGYISRYNPDAGNQPRKDFISREIRNPGKYKPRLIILSDNEIQDLATYIKNRLKSVCRLMPSSCTEDQMKGVRFALKVTNDQLVDTKQHNVFCWDWEDCTNNILWEFDDLVFGLVLPDLVPLWKELRAHEKHHRYATRGKEDRCYIQQGKGQPQGLGGSFDDMDLFHLVISMLVMKMTGREQIKLSDFVADLGDDDLTSTVTFDAEDPSDPLYRDEPGYRTKCELAFRRVCSWVNLKINDGKCIFNEYTIDHRPYEAEFAKVHVAGGEFDSPLPPRIAARYYDSAYQLIALNWEVTHGWDSIQFIDTILDRRFTDPVENYLSKILYKSGVVEGTVFNLYRDNTFSCDDRLKAIVKVAYYISAMKAGAIFNLQPDKDKQFWTISFDESLDAFKSLVNSPLLEEAWMGILDDEHKFNKLLLKNEDILDVIGEMYGIEPTPSKYASLLLTTDPQIRIGFLKAKFLMDCIPYWGDQTEKYFQPKLILDFDCSEISKACDLMLFKSARKRGKQELTISGKAINLAKDLLNLFPKEQETWRTALIGA